MPQQAVQSPYAGLPSKIPYCEKLGYLNTHTYTQHTHTQMSYLEILDSYTLQFRH